MAKPAVGIATLEDIYLERYAPRLIQRMTHELAWQDFEQFGSVEILA